VEGREPLWLPDGDLPVLTGLSTTKREVLVTTALDAIPDNRRVHPGDTPWPFYMALAIGVTFIGAIFTPWAYVIGFTLGAAAFAGWAWPRGRDLDELVRHGQLPRTGPR
jgi:cytochrome c oxidase subunit 1